MAHEVTCDGCQNKLLVPDDFRETWLTCPRCLARLVNPAALVVQDYAAPESMRPSPEISSCTRCGRALELGWQACPFCALTVEPGAVRVRGGIAGESALGVNPYVTNWGLATFAIMLIFGSAVILITRTSRDVGLAMLGVLGAAGGIGMLYVSTIRLAGDYLNNKAFSQARALAAAIVIGSLVTFLAAALFFTAVCSL